MKLTIEELKNKFMPKLKSKTPKERFSLGLDIGSHTIKAVKLKLVKDAAELCDFALESVQPNLTEALKKIRQALNAETVNISVCGPSSVIRYAIFPKMNKIELKQSLKFEAQKHIPFPLEEVNLDTHILKDDLPDNKMLVLLAAVKKDYISQRLKILEEAFFKVNIVNIDSLALVDAFSLNYSQSDYKKHNAVALLNIGSSVSNLNILEDALPRLSRDIYIAGNNFMQRLTDVFGADFKSSTDAQDTKKILGALEPVLANLAGSIRNSFDYYESESASSLTKIFLSGGSCKLNGLKDALGSLLGLEVEYWNPLQRLKLSEGISPEKIAASAVQLPVAVGLALRV